LLALCPECYEGNSQSNNGNMFSSFKKIFSKP
jgi:hypothetical protein